MGDTCELFVWVTEPMLGDGIRGTPSLLSLRHYLEGHLSILSSVNTVDTVHSVLHLHMVYTAEYLDSWEHQVLGIFDVCVRCASLLQICPSKPPNEMAP